MALSTSVGSREQIGQNTITVQAGNLSGQIGMKKHPGFEKQLYQI